MTGDQLYTAVYDARRAFENDLHRKGYDWTDARHHAKWHIMREVLPELLPAGSVLTTTSYTFGAQEKRDITIAKTHKNGMVTDDRGIKYIIDHGIHNVALRTRHSRRFFVIYNVTNPNAPVANSNAGQLDLFA